MNLKEELAEIDRLLDIEDPPAATTTPETAQVAATPAVDEKTQILELFEKNEGFAGFVSDKIGKLENSFSSAKSQYTNQFDFDNIDYSHMVKNAISSIDSINKTSNNGLIIDRKIGMMSIFIMVLAALSKVIFSKIQEQQNVYY